MRNNIHTAEFKLSVTLLLVILVVLSQGCQKTLELPAKVVVGTYVTRFPVYFSDQSDSCTFVYDVYDSTPIVMRCRITYLQENLVSVVLSADTAGNMISVPLDTLGTICQLGHQYSLPMTLRGIVGGTDPNTLVVERPYLYYDTLNNPHTAYYQLGNLSIDNTSISGNLIDINCDTLHCLGYKTNVFTLIKQ